MLKLSLVSVIMLLLFSCESVETKKTGSDWSLSVIPSSVRLDPVTNKIIDDRFILPEKRASQMLTC